MSPKPTGPILWFKMVGMLNFCQKNPCGIGKALERFEKSKALKMQMASPKTDEHLMGACLGFSLGFSAYPMPVTCGMALPWTVFGSMGTSTCSILQYSLASQSWFVQFLTAGEVSVLCNGNDGSFSNYIGSGSHANYQNNNIRGIK